PAPSSSSREPFPPSFRRGPFSNEPPRPSPPPEASAQGGPTRPPPTSRRRSSVSPAGSSAHSGEIEAAGALSRASSRARDATSSSRPASRNGRGPTSAGRGSTGSRVRAVGDRESGTIPRGRVRGFGESGLAEKDPRSNQAEWLLGSLSGPRRGRLPPPPRSPAGSRSIPFGRAAGAGAGARTPSGAPVSRSPSDSFSPSRSRAIR